MDKPTARDTSRASDADRVADKQRVLQLEQDRKDKSQVGKDKDSASKPVQAGAREQPVNPFTAQHLQQPGLEAQMQLAPRFEASD